MILTSAVLCILAFLSGSFPSGVLLSRLVIGRDVREVGSGNVGAANVARSAGLKAGIAVALLDILKGVAPMLLARWAGLDPIGMAAVAFAAVLGHDFSLFIGFRGGKGVATTVGVSAVLAPLPTALAAVVWLITLLIWRFTSLASLVALAALPVFMALTRQPPAYVIVTALLFLLGAGKHWENILRLVRGTESVFGRSSTRRDAETADGA